MDDAILQMIIRYLSGEADGTEKAKVLEWAASSEDNAREMERLTRVWDMTGTVTAFNGSRSERNKEEFLVKMIGGMKSEMETSDRRNRVFSLKNIIRYAAIIILTAGISSLLWLNSDRSQVIQSHARITAERGSRTNMVLPDGSRVWLNAGSTLRFSNVYDVHDREIYLEGEGYFEVEKNKKHPFIVHAGDIAVQATGTAFNVRAYSDEKMIETTLVEGSVVVFDDRNPGNMITMAPNEQVTYYTGRNSNLSQGNFVIMKGIKPELTTSWINGQLIFSNETLGSLAVKIERKYDVNIHFDDNSIKELRYTGMLHNETIEQVLDMLRASSHISYRIEKSEIWFSRN